jgi:hypothetical protein
LIQGLFPQTDAPATDATGTDVPVPDDDEEEAEAEAAAEDGDDDDGDDQEQPAQPPGGPPGGPPAPPPAGAERIESSTAPTAQAASPPVRDPRFPDGRPGPSTGPEEYAIGTPGDPNGEEEEEEEDEEKNKALQAQIEERARQLGEVRRFPSEAFSDPYSRKPKPLRPAELPSNIFEYTGETDYETGTEEEQQDAKKTGEEIETEANGMLKNARLKIQTLINTELLPRAQEVLRTGKAITFNYGGLPITMTASLAHWVATNPFVILAIIGTGLYSEYGPRTHTPVGLGLEFIWHNLKDLGNLLPDYAAPQSEIMTWKDIINKALVALQKGTPTGLGVHLGMDQINRLVHGTRLKLSRKPGEPGEPNVMQDVWQLVLGLGRGLGGMATGMATGTARMALSAANPALFTLYREEAA